MYDLVIIGGGPAGVAAGIYAARKQLKTLFLTYDFGGQSVVSPDIQNWVGTISIHGEQLAASLKTHLKTYEGEVLTIKEGVKVKVVEKSGSNFKVTTEGGESFDTKTVLVTTGGDRRKLKIPGAAEYEQKGITYCATCDGPLFADKEVVVIGGGNAAFESAAQLLAYCKSVTLLHHGADFKADRITIDQLMKNPKFHPVLNAETLEIRGNTFVTTLVYKDTEAGETRELAVEGVFVEIGFMPTTSFVKDVATLDSRGAVVVDPKTQSSSTAGIWAAGDCTDGLYHQNNIAAGDAIKAVENIYQYLHLK